MSDISDYQVNHLLLLIGSNPLPNAVAGKLLTAPGGTITLIHSADGLDLAQRLQVWLGKIGHSNVCFTKVEESDAASVYEEVSDLLKKKHSNANQARTIRVGLNYTGGTKVMSVQTHRALEDWTKQPGREAIFSYLDAHTLRMCFDPVPGRSVISFPVGLKVNIGIQELLELHNWKTIKPPVLAPVLPESTAALLKVHSNADDARIWSDWLHNELFPGTRKVVTLPPPFWVYQDGHLLEGQYEVKYPTSDNKWNSNRQLRDLSILWPDLPALREAMSNELGQPGAEKLNLIAAKGNGCKDEEEFCKWLSGVWLESAVLAALQNCPEELHLKHCCMDLKPKVLKDQKNKELFQFDVVALRGYQLFAFSCTTEDAQESGGKWLLKQKLFEAYVRAQQMGGDEARVALICCMTNEKAEALQEEMRRDLRIEGRIRVFGREDLAHLAEDIANWVREQSKEE